MATRQIRVNADVLGDFRTKVSQDLPNIRPTKVLEALIVSYLMGSPPVSLLPSIQDSPEKEVA